MTPLLLRAISICALLAATSVFLANARRSEITVPRSAFSSFPMSAGEWTAREDAPFDNAVLSVLGVDDYISRIYYRQDGKAAAGLYIGYYGSQRQGDTIHSPQNCLPGSGWEPVSDGRLRIANVAPGHDITVNRYIVQKGLDRQLVLYWYQSHGRVVASEYWSKAYLIADAIRLNRTDGSMVRVITPIASQDDGSAAERVAESFARAIFPVLPAYLPQ